MKFAQPRFTRLVSSVALLSMLSITGLSTAQAAPNTISKNAATPLSISVKTSIAKNPSNDLYTSQLLAIINEKRVAAGSKPVVWNQNIANVSQEWSENLGERTKSPSFDWSTIHRWDAGGTLIPKGATWYRENIAFASTARSIVDWWMSSPGHKAAMLDPKATDIGLGYVVPTSGPYTGWHMVVSNLAAYPTTNPGGTPKPTPTPSSSKVLNTIDTSGNLWAYTSPGNGTIGSRTLLGSGWGNAKQILTVDWNQDGIPDIVAKWGNGYVTFYEGLGNNNYKYPVNIGSGWQSFEITATKLRTTDKYPGLVARNVDEGKLYYYSNPAGGGIGGRTLIGGGGWSPMTELNAIDWDKDGKMDLLVRNSAGQLLVYRTDGSGNIVTENRPVVGTGWSGFQSIDAIPDFTGAGSTGVFAQSSDGKLLYYPITNSKFGAATTPGSAGWSNFILSNGTFGK